MSNQDQQSEGQVQDSNMPTPSQAEGDLEPGQQELPHTTPSQAEGDLDTVEDDLGRQEQKAE